VSDTANNVGARPYLQLSIEELERLAMRSDQDAPATAAILAELEFRNTARAGRLRNRLERKLSRSATSASHKVNPSAQSEESAGSESGVPTDLLVARSSTSYSPPVEPLNTEPGLRIIHRTFFVLGRLSKSSHRLRIEDQLIWLVATGVVWPDSIGIYPGNEQEVAGTRGGCTSR
jgi:hypothetical protein